ncbi:MAG: hypothetical protein AB1641_20880 [Thermodesulfobacteriota bacterium]
MKKRTVLFFLSLLFVFCLTAPVGHAAQPNMQKALEALQQAEKSLNKAAHDKEGHRVKALELVKQAIEEVKAGIKAGVK